MGLLDWLLGISPSYSNYDNEDEEEDEVSNKGKNMYCTQCRTIYTWGVNCPKCRNRLIEI